MKILFIHTKYAQSAGGEDTTFAFEVDLMKKHGHEVETCIFHNADMGSGLKGKLWAAASAVYNRGSAKKVAEVLERFRPDIVHVHNFFFSASPSVLVEVSRHNIPLVVTLHNYRLLCSNCLLLRDNKICDLCVNLDFPWYGVKYKCYHNSALGSAAVGTTAAVHKWLGTWKKKVDLFITPSSFSRQKFLHSSLNVAENKIRVKHNFIYDPGTGEMQDRKPFYLFVGRLSSEKGAEVLLKAWKLLAEEELIIAGDGPLQDDLLREYSGAANVKFIGKQNHDQVLALMKTCRALVFPSICYEGLPLTIVEAFATGTPVIASYLGGMKEMVINDYNGQSFEAGNENELAATVRSFSDRVKTGDLSLYENAKKTYLEQYHPDSCYAQTIAIYTSLIQARKING